MLTATTKEENVNMAKDVNDKLTKDLVNENTLSKEQVKELRLKAGKTQVKAANDLHQADGAFWRKFENGSREISSSQVELFCLKNTIKYPPF
jgi:hypothetical protein